MADTNRRNSILAATTLLLLQHYPLGCHAWSQLRPLTKHHSPLSIRRRSSNLLKRVSRKVGIPPTLELSSSKAEEDLDMLRNENSVLRETIRQLEEENQNLKQNRNSNIVLESFEGESLFRDRGDDPPTAKPLGITLSGDEIAQDEQWCDELKDGR